MRNELLYTHYGGDSPGSLSIKWEKDELNIPQQQGKMEGRKRGSRPREKSYMAWQNGVGKAQQQKWWKT